MGETRIRPTDAVGVSAKALAEFFRLEPYLATDEPVQVAMSLLPLSLQQAAANEPLKKLQVDRVVVDCAKSCALWFTQSVST
jgi:hypothetical protein